MVPFKMVQLDNETPILAKHEHSITDGIRGEIGLCLWDETIEKNGHILFRCHVEETLHHRALEIPAWMFDSACRAMFLTDIPTVNCEALGKVKVLLSASRHDPIVKEAERLEGGVDAKETESKSDTVGTVLSDNENSHVDSNAPERAANGDRVDVAIAAPTPRKDAQPKSGGQQ